MDNKFKLGIWINNLIDPSETKSSEAYECRWRGGVGGVAWVCGDQIPPLLLNKTSLNFI